MNTDLHLYVDVLENESIETATKRTNDIIESTFGNYGFSIFEIGENEELENEIKAFIAVDIEENEVFKVAKDLNIQVY